MLGRNALRCGLVALALSFTALALARASRAQSSPNARDFDVEFTDCVESIGVALLATDQVRALVPPEFVLAGDGGPVTPIVVRTSRCGGIAVDRKTARPGTIVQIGAVIIPPDFTGDVNNYTLWYYTSDPQLASRLNRIGVPAQHVQRIDYEHEPGDSGPGRFHVSVPLQGRPQLRLDGFVLESDASAGSFAANWWVKAPAGSVKMATAVPDIFIGAADLVLTTPAGGPLGALIGGDTLRFPILQQFNTFPHASMRVSAVAP
jgi:hypothetical protein